MGKVGTVNWTGASRKSYSFDVYTLDTRFNEAECVYLYTKTVNNVYQPIYVGQTSQLATRLDQHANGDEDSDKCIQRSGATHLHVHLLKLESSRFTVETDIRNNYKWSCNMR
jgi:predicted GIY-YIG superfamily endonuclease